MVSPDRKRRRISPEDSREKRGENGNHKSSNIENGKRTSNSGNEERRSLNSQKSDDKRSRAARAPSVVRRIPGRINNYGRQERDRSPKRERPDDRRDQRIPRSELEEKLRVSEKINANLERRLRESEKAKEESQQLLKSELVKKATPLDVHCLQMQIQNLQSQLQQQEALLQQANQELEMARDCASANGNRLYSVAAYLRGMAGSVGLVRLDYQVLKQTAIDQLTAFKSNFGDTCHQMIALTDAGYLSRILVQSPLTLEGKIIVEERHLKELLNSVHCNMARIAKDIFDAMDQAKMVERGEVECMEKMHEQDLDQEKEAEQLMETQMPGDQVSQVHNQE